MGAIVVIPPWTIGGSMNMFQSTVRNYINRGFKTYVLVASDNKTAGRSSDNFLSIINSGQFEGVELITRTESKSRRRSFPRAAHAWLRRGRGTTLFEKSLYINACEIPVEIINIVEFVPIEVVHVHHCFNILLGERIAGMARSALSERPRLFCETHDIQANNSDVLKLRHPVTRSRSSRSDIATSELKLLSRADVAIHISNSDAEYFRRGLPDRVHFTLPPTLAPATERALVSLRNCKHLRTRIVYVGVNHDQNIRAVIWLLKHVIPIIPEALKYLSIFGAVIRGVKRRAPVLYEKHKSCFHGEVADISTVYRDAKAILVPSLGGTGISLKLIEAMCSGRSIVASTNALRGLDKEIRNLAATNSARDFAGAIRNVISGMPLNSCPRIYDEYFSNETYARRFSDIIKLLDYRPTVRDTNV